METAKMPTKKPPLDNHLKFKIMDSTSLDCVYEGRGGEIVIETTQGQRITISLTNSDGDATVEVRGSRPLMIAPRASNVVRVI